MIRATRQHSGKVRRAMAAEEFMAMLDRDIDEITESLQDVAASAIRRGVRYRPIEITVKVVAEMYEED